MTKELTFAHPPTGHNAILGYDSVNDRWQAAYVNASGQLVVNIGAGLADLLTELQQKLETADLDLDASGRLSINQHQYDGSAWCKSNLLWGYNDRYSEQVASTNLSAGTNTLYTTAVPTGYVYRVTFVSGYVVSATITWMFYAAYDGTYLVPAVAQRTPASYQWYPATLDAVLKAGDKFAVQVLGATAGDDVTMLVWGSKMRVNM